MVEPQFKIGDRVETELYSHYEPDGKRSNGTVVAIHRGTKTVAYLVQHDRSIVGGHTGNDPGITLPDGTGWWYYDRQLQPEDVCCEYPDDGSESDFAGMV